MAQIKYLLLQTPRTNLVNEPSEVKNNLASSLRALRLFLADLDDLVRNTVRALLAGLDLLRQLDVDIVEPDHLAPARPAHSAADGGNAGQQDQGHNGDEDMVF